MLFEGWPGEHGFQRNFNFTCQHNILQLACIMIKTRYRSLLYLYRVLFELFILRFCERGLPVGEQDKVIAPLTDEATEFEGGITVGQNTELGSVDLEAMAIWTMQY